ncbi:MAG TPA: type II secretion system F family protein [Arenicellales bacterium]|nr:type II secretion system F family protein [Arenicellales bacterium]HJP09865.1 type II secretion system F family protein [Arenicellales bacterium]
MASRKEKPVATYVWTGSDRQGKPTGGELEISNAAEARSTLRRQGIRVKSLKKKSKPLFSQKLKGKDIAIATRQLAVMLNAGIPIATSYGAIAGGTDHPKIREIFTAIRTDVEGGTALSEALARFPRQFDNLYTNLVAVGERSGNLDNLMVEIANYMENLEEIKAKIKGALFYPAAVLVVGIGVSTLLLLFVVPQFEALFTGFGASLPALTAGIVAASRFVQDYWLFVFSVLAIVIVTIVMSYRRSTKFQRAVDRFSLRMPLFGNLLRKASISRYARTLATMFGSGVPLVEALTSVSGATGSSVYQDACLEIRESVSTGRSLSASMADTGLFPTMVIQMTNTGEESGSIEEMLSKAADFYESEVREMVDNMSKLIEPLMMVVLGGLVGTLVVGMYLPIFKMGSVV